MNNPGLALLLLLLTGCASAPGAPFDAGHDVHVIAVSAQHARIRPTCTVGALVEQSSARYVGGARRAVEVAIIRAPKGEHRFSFFDPMTYSSVRQTLTVEGDTWVVVSLAGDSAEVYETPPNEQLGRWVPLVVVSD